MFPSASPTKELFPSQSCYLLLTSLTKTPWFGTKVVILSPGPGGRWAHLGSLDFRPSCPEVAGGHHRSAEGSPGGTSLSPGSHPGDQLGLLCSRWSQGGGTSDVLTGFFRSGALQETGHESR